MSFKKSIVRKLMPFVLVSLAALGLALAYFGFFDGPQTNTQDQGRAPYEHVMRITARLEFDGEEIVIDDLIDCQSNYRGPSSRAVQLPFRANRHWLANETAAGGMVVVTVPSGICSSYPEKWAETDTRLTVSDAWTPLISWYDHRNANEIVRGEVYFSEVAIKNPSGRLKILDGFRVTVPTQTKELLAQAMAQAVERDVWQGDPPRGQSAFLGITPLAWYIRIPPEQWMVVPEYLYAPDIRTSDFEGLRNLLLSLPEGEGLLQIGNLEDVSNREDIRFAITDMVIGKMGGLTTIGYHGIPQKEEHLWGMFLNERSWQRAKDHPERIPFYNENIPLDYQNGVLVLRTDTPGMRYLYSGWGDWYRQNEDRPVDFMGKPFVDGPFDNIKSLLIFDMETRDLWFKSYP